MDVAGNCYIARSKTLHGYCWKKRQTILKVECIKNYIHSDFNIILFDILILNAPLWSLVLPSFGDSTVLHHGFDRSEIHLFATDGR